MGLCIAVCLAAVILIYVCKIKGEWYVIRRPCLVLCIFGALGIFSGIADAQDKTYGQLERNPPGEGELETEAYVYFVEEGTEYGLTLSIPEQKYKPSKEQELLAAAVEEMQQTFCGNNTSVYEISQNPDVRESYQDGAVSAEWLFSERALISAEGELDQKAVKKLGDGTHKVEAAVTFVCGESMQEYTFAFWVAPGKRNRKEELEIAVEAQIAGQDRTSSRITLPGYIDGEEVRWRAPPSVQPEEVLGLGALAGSRLVCRKRKAKAGKRKKETGIIFGISGICQQAGTVAWRRDGDL